jgi:Spy/CpxP family protein refolding chaperone
MAARATGTDGQRGGATPGTSQRGGPSRPDPLPPTRWEWWKDATVQKEVGLTPEQVQRLDAMVKDRERELAPFIREFIRQREELNRLAAERAVGIEAFAIQVARVDSLYAKLSESRTVMLYRMSRELSDEQYKKLQEVRDRRMRSGGRGGSQNR